MRKLSIILLLAIVSFALHAGTIEKTYSFGKPTIAIKNGYQVVEFNHLLLTGKLGEPSLPYQEVKLLLPPGEVAVSISFEGIGETMIPGFYQLYPQQASRPLSDPGPGTFQKNQSVYNTDVSYPYTPSGQLTTAYLNGYAVALSTFTPVLYNPVTGQVSYYEAVKIIIETTPSNKSTSALANLSGSSRIQNRVLEYVQNPEIQKSYPEVVKDTEDYQLLIITPEQFEDDFEDYTTMYRDRGFKAEIHTIETIEGTASGQDLPEQIRNYIIDEYQDHSIEFVMLGGDVEHVPYRGFYCYVESGSGYTDYGIPADLYFSALDGTWDDDNDNVWGEIGEDDLLPDVAVARFSFSNTTELGNMINKAVSYQNDPVLGEFNDVVLAGEWLYGNPETYGSDYLELLIGYQDENGYETYGIPEDYTYYKLYESVSSWSANDLIDEINSGRQFVHHVGHANSNYVAFMSNSTITDANFYGANGTDHNYTLMQSHGCICGAFDDSDCIMEKMVSIQNFAVSVIGNSRYGWFNEGQTEGPAQHLHREMVDAMYHEKMNFLGQAFVESKIQTAPWVTAPGQWEEGALRWNFYDINILGDPMLSVWTQEPIDIEVDHAGVYTLGAGTYDAVVTSGGEPLENFHCALIYEDQIYGAGSTDENGEVVLDVDDISVPGDAKLVVSGYNCLPQEFDVTIILAGPTYVHYLEHLVDDSQGNGNGLIDFGEASLKLDMTLENLGEEQADDITAVLSTTSSYITITNGNADFGSIAATSSYTLDAAFEFEVANDVPDQTVIEFELTITWSGSEEQVVNYFTETAHAPVLSLGSILIDDSQNGNGNGIMDPGETLDLTAAVWNEGSCPSPEAEAVLFTNNPDITLVNSSSDLGVLASGGMSNATFTLEVSEDAQVGTNVDFDLEVEAEAYQLQEAFSMTVGLVLEDFESGDFQAYGWSFSGAADWEISDQDPFEGSWCAKSGTIGDQQESELQISMEVLAESEISFYRKVSSEASYDYLRFYIDSQMMGEWAGEEDWDQEVFAVSPGQHTFTWSYEKDYSVSNGSDCAWVDFIVFPAATGYANVLGVAASASPEEVCLGFSAQLTATATGGSGTYNYLWEPSAGLTSSSIPNPVATPDQTTTYTVTVDDGENTETASVTLVVNENPVTPSIAQEDDHLVSSSASGNQWYDTDGPISGATAQTYFPTNTDNYYVIVENEYGCASDPSNTLYFVYTGFDDIAEEHLKVYPNPTSGLVVIEVGVSVPGAQIQVSNLLNQIVLRQETSLRRGDSMELDLEFLDPGVYIISITGKQLRTTRKITIQ